jgi:non-specific serine/threonine protein kinase
VPQSELFATDCRGWDIDFGVRKLCLRDVAAPIGSRPFEMLDALVSASGELVTENDLIRRVWAGAIVADNTIEFHISAIRVAGRGHG